MQSTIRNSQSLNFAVNVGRKKVTKGLNTYVISVINLSTYTHLISPSSADIVVNVLGIKKMVMDKRRTMKIKTNLQTKMRLMYYSHNKNKRVI